MVTPVDSVQRFKSYRGESSPNNSIQITCISFLRTHQTHPELDSLNLMVAGLQKAVTFQQNTFNSTHFGRGNFENENLFLDKTIVKYRQTQFHTDSSIHYKMQIKGNSTTKLRQKL